MSANQLIEICRELSDQVDQLNFLPPTTHVYNPLRYARNPVEQYLEKAGRRGKEVMFLGMNPGPWGMAQTGVPFGTVPMVRDWIGIEGPVERPLNEHPKRPIRGFGETREEVSGSRFWGWARDRFETAEAFFERFFVANYGPLVFMEASGRNRTPDKLPVAEKQALFRCCDQALLRMIEALEPKRVIGVGKFAEHCARRVIGGSDIPVGRILHPSPASPIANRGWAPQAEQQLLELGVALPPAS